MDLNYPANWQDCYLVLFYESDSKRKVTYCKPITEAHNSKGHPLGFYGVRASIYGVSIPVDTTNWAICKLGVAEPEILVEGKMPEAQTILEIAISETDAIQFTRYNRNFKFSIGLKYELRPKKGSGNKAKTVQTVNDVFTVEESLELLFS
jgi:hypothetical protein